MKYKMTTKHFCTLFDSNYLTRGLALYESLKHFDEDFELYVVCFDQLAFDVLSSLRLPSIAPIRLSDFESAELLEIKSSRTPVEYCWTCTPHVIRYVLETYGLDEVTYLDADLYFFDKPSVLLDEFHASGASVLITEHRYTPEYDLTAESGVYCVQFMTFKSDGKGMTVLQWWQNRCTEWCYCRVEEGKMGDQKYLDHWTTMFEGVHVLQHLGGGVAPWNVQQYKLEEGPIVDDSPVVFYHFHSLKWISYNQFYLGNYELPESSVRLFYRPYFASLKEQLRLIQMMIPGFERGIAKITYDWTDWKTPLRIVKRQILKILGVYHDNTVQG